MPLCSALKQRLQLVAGLECSRERSGATGTDESQRSCMLQQVGQQRGQAGQIRSKEGGGHTGTKEQTGVRCECGQGHKQAEKETAGAAASGVGSSSATTRQALNSPRSGLMGDGAVMSGSVAGQSHRLARATPLSDLRTPQFSTITPVTLAITTVVSAPLSPRHCHSQTLSSTWFHTSPHTFLVPCYVSLGTVVSGSLSHPSVSAPSCVPLTHSCPSLSRRIIIFS
ncbi:unnamed protein product [Closterium sp. NIES-54]